MYIYIYVRVCVCVSCLSLSMCVCAHVTLQEYNIEKMQLVEAEKGRIRKEYERKEGQVEVLKKMYVFSLSTTSCVCVSVRRGEEVGIYAKCILSLWHMRQRLRMRSRNCTVCK